MFILFAAILFGSQKVSAQAFNKGNFDINAGIGVGGSFGLPIGLSADYGVSDKISIGAYAGYASTTEELLPGIKWKYTYIIVGARGAYHFALADNLDTYAGLLLGYNAATVTFDGVSSSAFGGITPTAGGLAWSGFLGGRYRFTDNIGIFAELGYGIAILQAGVNFKFGGK